MILPGSDDQPSVLGQGEFERHGLWVFGYGSLMWRPGFHFEDRAEGRCFGVHRRFCVRSVYHRGCYKRPGLVLGLDGGGVCEGVLFYVPPAKAAETVRYLRKREQVTRVYREVFRPVELGRGSGRYVRALCFIADRGHAQYTGALSVPRQAEIIKRCSGQSGTNLDYLLSTYRHVCELGFSDGEMKRVLVMTGCSYKL